MFEKRAMLVELNIHQWTARKHDRSVSSEIDRDHGAKNAGRYNKQLINKDALSEINRAADALRTMHYAYTLPWGNNGQRLLPAALLMEYRQNVVTLRSRFDNAVSTFIDGYGEWIKEAATRLNSLFDPDDYPKVTDLRNKFNVSLELFPVPTAGDFRVDVAAEERDEIAAQIEASMQERQQRVADACRTYAREVLDRVVAACSPIVSRISQSLANDVKTLTNILGSLNVTEDENIIRLLEHLRTQFEFDVETLRKDKQARWRMRKNAQELLDTYLT